MERISTPYTTSNYSLTLPPELTWQLIKVVSGRETDPMKLIANSVKLGMILEALDQPNADAKMYVKQGQKLQRLPFDFRPPGTKDEDDLPFFDLEQEFRKIDQKSIKSIKPKEDLRFILRHVRYNDGQPLTVGSNPLQQVVQSLALEAASNLLTTYDSCLDFYQKSKLAKIPVGVGVIKDLIKLEDNPLDDIDIPDTVVGRWLKETLRPFVYIDLHGVSFGGSSAVLIDSGYLLDDKVPQQEKLHTVGHEIWHAISWCNLPTLLIEASADFYTGLACDTNTSPENRMGANYKAVFRLWERVDEIVGRDVAISGALESSIIQQTVDPQTGRIISSHFTNYPLHTRMHDIAGENKHGNKWDQALDLIDQKRGVEAYRLLFPKQRRWFFRG